MWGIIGGTGFERFDDLSVVEELDLTTPFGQASSGLKRIKIEDNEAVFIPRHGLNHELLPSEVNYRANVYALKAYGAKRILSISAIGSLRPELAPGDLVVPKQYIDRTKSLRDVSFCGQGVVGHVSLAHPTCQACSTKLKEFANSFKFRSHFDKTYVCIEGPYFSTQAESNVYRSLNADIIGMTNFPEYALTREAGLCYLPCCFVTDYDCWDDSIKHVTLEDILETIRLNNAKAFELAKTVLSSFNNMDYCCAEIGLASGLLTALEKLPEDQREAISLVCR